MSKPGFNLTVSKQKGTCIFLATIFTGLEIINNSVFQNFTSLSRPVHIVSTNLVRA